MEKVKVTVSIPKEYLEKIETRAVELGVTRADLMRCVLADYLTGRKHVMEVRPQKVVESKNTNETRIISDEKPAEGVFNSL